MSTVTARSRVSGNFSFPIVRPGEWTLKIYPNSIPNGYVVDKNEFVLLLKPGAKQELEIDVKPKQRNIIFKSQTTLLTPTKTTTPKEEPVPVIISSKVTNDSVFYSVQVGAFSKRKTNNVGYFEKIPYDFEKQTSKYYKYFIPALIPVL